jgi:hypothetical protein
VEILRNAIEYIENLEDLLRSAGVSSRSLRHDLDQKPIVTNTHNTNEVRYHYQCIYIYTLFIVLLY